MLKKIDITLISIITLLGIAHTSCTLLFYNSFSMDALWFAGAGLSFIFLGLLHVVRIISNNRIITSIALAASIIALVYNILIIILLPKPQAYIGLIAIASLVIILSYNLIRWKHTFIL